jgi:hypothetical protein
LHLNVLRHGTFIFAVISPLCPNIY